MKESAIDDILIQGWGVKSYNELSEETGLDPDECARRIQEIASRVMLTPEQQLARNIYLYQQIANTQMQLFSQAKPEDVARLGNTAAGALGRLSAEIERMTKLQAQDTTERDLAMVRVLVEEVGRVVKELLPGIKELPPAQQTEEGVAEVILTRLQDVDEDSAL